MWYVEMYSMSDTIDNSKNDSGMSILPCPFASLNYI